MNREETAKLVMAAVAFFPHLQDKDMGPTVVGWSTMLNDVDYPTAEKALQKVLATAKFFPTIAEIREAIVELTQPSTGSWLDAWGEVRRAISNHGYNHPKEALESMTPLTAYVVRCIGWMDICTSEEPEVIRGQFRMAYEQNAKRKKEMAVLPEGLRILIEGTSQRMLVK